MVNKAKRVYVYFNLHKKCWSVRQSGKIIEHTNMVMLKDCRWLVGQAGRRKVLKEKKKNVHAGVSGYLVDRVPNVPEHSSYLTYNPYKHKTFVSGIDPVKSSDYAFLECGDWGSVVEAIWE